MLEGTEQSPDDLTFMRMAAKNLFASLLKRAPFCSGPVVRNLVPRSFCPDPTRPPLLQPELFSPPPPPPPHLMTDFVCCQDKVSVQRYQCERLVFPAGNDQHLSGRHSCTRTLPSPHRGNEKVPVLTLNRPAMGGGTSA